MPARNRAGITIISYMMTFLEILLNYKTDNTIEPPSLQIQVISTYP